jgi:hypothetical protein
VSAQEFENADPDVDIHVDATPRASGSRAILPPPFELGPPPPQDLSPICSASASASSVTRSSSPLKRTGDLQLPH